MKNLHKERPFSKKCGPSLLTVFHPLIRASHSSSRLMSSGCDPSFYGTELAQAQPQREGNILLCVGTADHPQTPVRLPHGGREDLWTNGRLGVVDFANTRLSWFRRWMWRNHVRLDNHLNSAIKRHIPSCALEEGTAYAGVWNYSLFLGTCPSNWAATF